ncbi:DNA-binding response OmpR family regulator [Kitasatospora sp. MAA4]|uniref:response regulator transcription factor n=1 Tax=Kitasatospora sp. MAA4 TaxID=3035093 RepID=UPI002476306E|nr:response regulator transcription factor [Kitasatospora sp. MAA4]MDH6137704.1 DNA-binding response OmpR family regulator [Kitasatospora sp. MAA4]
MASVLVVEDDPIIRTSLIQTLTTCGHLVRSSPDGFGALREITQSPPDAVVLDLGLPDIDGADALRMIRGLSRVPVLVATARDDDLEIIRLLNAGADDYLVKPFSGGQLAARLEAVLRRCLPAAAGAPQSGAGSLPGGGGDPYKPERAPMVIGELRIDPLARVVQLAGQDVQLTRREFDLLAFLAEHAGRVVSRQRILSEVWRRSYLDEQTVDVHLSCLRRKLGECAAQPRFLHTVRGVGVKLVCPP